MLGALFKKQFSELIAQFARKNQNKDTTPTKRLVVFFVIFGIIYLSLGFSFFTFSSILLQQLTPDTFSLFYMVVGLITVAVGLLGSVFNAYSTIFDAKDTEMLLSMPIPPRYIVFARVSALTVMTVLFEGAVLIPSFIAYLTHAHPSVLGGLYAFLSFIPLTLLVISLTIGLAYLVAAISRKITNKKIAITILTIAVVALFYLVYFRAQNAVTALVQAGSIPAGVKYGLFFFYLLGRASEGSTLGFFLPLLFSVAVFALTYLLLSRSFVKFVTTQTTPAAKGKKGKIEAKSPRLALYKREWKLFLSSPAYILNSAFGVIVLVVIGVFSFVKLGTLRLVPDYIQTVFPHANGCAVGAILVMMAVAMNDITAPSISMEGNRLYILRSLPVSASEVFFAKIALHLSLVLPPALFASAAVMIALGADVLSILFFPLAVIAFTLFDACLGLCLNVRNPILDWTDENVAVRTGMSVLVTIFGMIVLSIALGALYLPFAFFVSDWVYLAVVTLLLGGADALMIYWLGTGGKKKFEQLG